MEVLSSFMLKNFFFILLLFMQAKLALADGLQLNGNEKNALREIAWQVGKVGWNLDLNPCDDVNPNRTMTHNDMPVICNCSYPADGFCHIVKIFLLGEDIHVLPPSLPALPYLNTVELGKCMGPCRTVQRKYPINCILRMNDSEVYRTPLDQSSMTYYVRCLHNIIFSLEIHIAEDNDSFRSLGLWKIDLYIQGEEKLKGYHLEQKKDLSQQGQIVTFRATVTKEFLEVRLNKYWLGTAAVPRKGIYGPMISAIYVKPYIFPNTFEDGKARWQRVLEVVTSVLMAWLSFGILCFIMVIIGILYSWTKYTMGWNTTSVVDLEGLASRVNLYTLDQIKVATNNFSDANKIGQGGFGCVYKGSLHDGSVVAIKQLISVSRKANSEFVNELGLTCGLNHPNLVKLYGCCVQGSLHLVHEFMPNNSLFRALFGQEGQQLALDWPTRYKICTGIARGLAYMNELSSLKIMHRDINTSNVLLDDELNAKVSDFGLAKLYEGNSSQIVSKAAGTLVYMAPGYLSGGRLNEKIDVYSFGCLVLEVVAKKQITFSPDPRFVNLLDWARFCHKKATLMEIVDATIGPTLVNNEAKELLQLAILY